MTQTNSTARSEIANRHRHLFDLLRSGQIKANVLSEEDQQTTRPPRNEATDMMDWQRKAMASLRATERQPR